MVPARDGRPFEKKEHGRLRQRVEEDAGQGQGQGGQEEVRIDVLWNARTSRRRRKKDWDSEDEPELESEEDEAEDDMISGEEDDDEGFRPKPKKKAPPKGRPARSERALQRSERKADPASAAAADAAAAVAAAAVEFVENFDDDDDEADDAVDAEHTLAKCAEFSERLMLEFRKSISAGDEGAHALSAASMDAMLGNGAPREAGAFNPATMAEVNSVCAASLRLREHQLVGVNWLLLMERVGANGVLADDMGLGKTVQTICYLALSRARRKAAGNPHKGMDAVVVPASTLANWLAEFKRFAPATNVVVYHGALADRATQRAKYRVGSGIDVVLTTYTWWERDQCQDDRKFFGDNSPWNHVVLDEGHSLKNPRASRTRRLKALKSTSRTILSGTPIQNDTMDVLSLLSYLMPDLFTDTDGLLALAGQMASGDGSFERLRQLLAPFVLRRVKAQVLASLPPKTTHVLRVSLEQAQRAIYVGVTAKHVAAKRRRSAAAAEGAVLSFDDAQARNVFSELRKAANHPLLLRSKYNAEALAAIATVALHRGHFGKAATAAMVSTELEGYSDLDLHEICVEYAGDLGARALRTDDLYDSAKFSALRDLLPKLKQQGHRVLLFSQWVRLLDLLQLLCTDLGLKTCRLDGSTPVAERQELVLQFNAEASDLDVFLLSTRAGGLGLNLAGADTVVIHDVDFNPEVDRQAEDRAHRIGQTRDVTVYKLVSDETVDDDILQIAQRKREVNEKVLRADDDDGAKPNADVPPRAAVASAIARALREYEHHERAAAEIAAAESAAPA
ncbi:SNF2 family N-terminal domain-containing protein [Pelagophyceae sp. CCMP2097]|nr:SNF2 family N-terminal domain-containing protein [Pelagophyceae sp. CCMP2097]